VRFPQPVRRSDVQLKAKLVASKHPFQAQEFLELANDQHRCIRVEFDELVLFGVYFAQNVHKIPLFEFLYDQGASIFKQKALLIGDFNTGRNGVDNEGATFIADEHFEKLLEQGWVDTWRSRNPDVREYSWYSRKHGKPLNGWLSHRPCTGDTHARSCDQGRAICT
jgi:exonuclease III